MSSYGECAICGNRILEWEAEIVFGYHAHKECRDRLFEEAMSELSDLDSVSRDYEDKKTAEAK